MSLFDDDKIQQSPADVLKDAGDMLRSMRSLKACLKGADEGEFRDLGKQVLDLRIEADLIWSSDAGSPCDMSRVPVPMRDKKKAMDYEMDSIVRFFSDYAKIRGF